MGMSDVPGCYRDTVAMDIQLLCLAEAGMEHKEGCLHCGGGGHRDPKSLSRGRKAESSLYPKPIHIGPRVETMGNTPAKLT